ncbi:MULTISPECIES: alpha/beta fold hydrolase [unclassified Crossiella]|uniref:alpha/beta fold hydrolase n=1 Tax=unclassified Crossiella TaxID=2620835 RepID=UPI001FFEB3E5|nr:MULTISPECIES: alpha/beta fold hydrolase [unclassified Crossiella]MCK2244371.1 alpha/beta hydrolase [Crossiella sp. S99.2]MCK2257801.1 alpha/beta hydrolase [Crossiella sp. S99.1]
MHPVLLVHALGDTGAGWRQLRTVLAAPGRQVLTPDLRGHGGTAAGYTAALVCADLIAVLDRHGLAQVDVVGHSLGGHVATLLAQRQPHRVRRLVLEDPPPPPRDDRDAAAIRARAQPLTAFLRDRRGRVDPRAVRAFIEELREPDPDWWRRLAVITARTLVISGGLDSPVPPALLARVAATIPDARLLAASAGHHVHQRRPEFFGTVVSAFLA